MHTNGKASESARAINAQAYTVGTDIVFAAGEYRPNESEGRRLLAHELAHVCQQSMQPSQSLWRQTPPATVPTHSDQIVQTIIDDALKQKDTVEKAFLDLQGRRCDPNTCEDENLAAAEHYLFARHVVQDSRNPTAWAFSVASVSAVYQAVKVWATLLGLKSKLSLCPDICPVTPPS